MYTLGTAARACGVSKSTIHRAIKRGALSARSKDGNGYEIDPAELHRVFPLVSRDVPRDGSEKGSVERCATGEENGRNGERSDRDVEIRLARAEAQLEALKQVLELERNRSEELKTERDRWQEQAARLALAPPAPPVQPAPRSWWPWRRSA